MGQTGSRLQTLKNLAGVQYLQLVPLNSEVCTCLIFVSRLSAQVCAVARRVTGRAAWIDDPELSVLSPSPAHVKQPVMPHNLRSSEL